MRIWSTLECHNCPHFKGLQTKSGYGRPTGDVTTRNEPKPKNPKSKFDNRNYRLYITGIMRNQPATSRSLAPFLIDGAHPAEYAAQFGDTTRDGVHFYNCSDVARDGRTIATPHYTAEQWGEFYNAIERLAARDWVKAEDVAKLAILARWAAYMQGRATSSLPWLNRAI